MPTKQEIKDLEANINRIDHDFRLKIKRVKLGLSQETKKHNTWFKLSQQKLRIMKAKTRPC